MNIPLFKQKVFHWRATRSRLETWTMKRPINGKGNDVTITYKLCCNRTAGAHTVLMTSKDMKKKERGYYASACDGRICIVKCMDNSTVCIASNCLSHEPTHVVRRYVKPNPNQSVVQPHIIHQYNIGMGGVDVMDRLLSSYRPMLRGMKWWWPLFLNVISLCVVAAWKVYHNLHGADMDHLSFRRDIVMSDEDWFARSN